MKHTPIGYTYEADYHCPSCAEKRFGRDSHGHISGIDAETNEVGAVAPWDVWEDEDNLEPQVLACGTCTQVIATWSLQPLRHVADSDCTGLPVSPRRSCSGCLVDLCDCEYNFGHECAR